MDRIQSSRKFAEKHLRGIDTAHGIKHTEITAKYAKIISQKENANTELCIIAALLHDICRNKGNKLKKETIKKNHCTQSAKKAKPFLISLGFSSEEINLICKAISQHCFPKIQKSIISKILWDSDKLNMFSKEMKSEYIQYWKKQGWTNKKIIEQIKKERKFYLKRFHTKTARTIAEKNLFI